MKRVAILILFLLGAEGVGGCNLISGINDLQFKDSDSVPPTDETTPTDADACASYSCDGDQLCQQRLCDGSTHTCTNSGGTWQWRTTAACDDGSSCTSDDICSGSICQGTACESGTFCDANACATCNTDAHCGADCKDCTATGLSCNAAKTACVLTNCEGKDDFTPCETVTADPTDRSYDICISAVCKSPGCGDLSCNAPGPHFPLADTNQRVCYNDSGIMTCPSSGQSFYGQDAQYGWDVTNEETGRYTRTEPVAAQPIVEDNVTGLVWQGCAVGLSGSSCTTGNASTYTWSNALATCDSLAWGGYEDWRLPDLYELSSIVDRGRYGPSIQPSSFPATPPSGAFWSSSSYARYLDDAWEVSFNFAMILNGGKEDDDWVRCVRGGP